MNGLRIGELAGKLDLNPQTIRYYERVGLVPEPKRTEVGYRIYKEEDERRLRFIRNAREVGLTLGEIKEVLGFRERGEAPCGYVTEVIGHRTEEVERRIEELKVFKRELDRLRERARREPVRAPDPDGYCHLIG